MTERVLEFLTLNYPMLKGKRTLIGLLLYLGPDLLNHVANVGACADSRTAFCLTLQAVAAWFLAMGIRGK